MQTDNPATIILTRRRLRQIFGKRFAAYMIAFQVANEIGVRAKWDEVRFQDVYKDITAEERDFSKSSREIDSLVYTEPSTVTEWTIVALKGARVCVAEGVSVEVFDEAVRVVRKRGGYH